MRVPWEGLREEETCEIIYHLFISIYLDFPGGPAHAGDLSLNPRLGRLPEEGNGYPLQYSGMENSMGFTVHGVAKS